MICITYSIPLGEPVWEADTELWLMGLMEPGLNLPYDLIVGKAIISCSCGLEEGKIALGSHGVTTYSSVFFVFVFF